MLKEKGTLSKTPTAPQPHTHAPINTHEHHTPLILECSRSVTYSLVLSLFTTQLLRYSFIMYFVSCVLLSNSFCSRIVKMNENEKKNNNKNVKALEKLFNTYFFIAFFFLQILFFIFSEFFKINCLSEIKECKT